MDKQCSIRASFLIFLPHLMLKFGWLFLKFKQKAKKGGRTFKKELLNHGIDSKTASELTDIYMQPSNLTEYMGYLK